MWCNHAKKRRERDLMKRDFLKSLGIEDKAIIDKILDENSADIGRAKGEVDDLKTQITTLQSSLDKKTSEFDALKESTKDYADLSAKTQKLEADNAQLIADKKQLNLDLDNRVNEIMKTNEVEKMILKANGKNVKAIMALMDMDAITYDGEAKQVKGAKEQLDTLIAAEDSSMLFGESRGNNLSGVTPADPVRTQKTTTLSFSDAIAKALSSQNQNPNTPTKQ